MKPSQCLAVLDHCLNISRPVLFWGAPGVGKTDGVSQVALRRGMQTMVQCPAQLDAVDTRGLPTVRGDETIWTRPEILPADGEGILFLDDLNTGLPAILNGLLQLVRNRMLGKYKLGDGWRIVGACNRTTDKGHVQRMSSALSNRFLHIDWDPDVADLCKHAAMNDWAPEVIAFLQWRPELIHIFTWAAAERTRTGAMPELDLTRGFESSRAWESMSDHVKARGSLPAEVEHDVFVGEIGKRGAVEFSGFIRVFRDLPNPRNCLMNPDSAAVPEKAIVQAALAGALARLATDANFDRVLRYAGRMLADVGVSLVKQAIWREPALQQSGAFIKWAELNQHVLV